MVIHVSVKLSHQLHVQSQFHTLGLVELASMTILSPSFSPRVAMVTCSGEGESSFWDDSPEMPLERPLDAVEWLGAGDLDTGTGKWEKD